MPGSPGPTRPSVQRPYFPVVMSRAAVIPVSSLVLHSVRNLLEYFTHLGKKASDEEYKSRPTNQTGNPTSFQIITQASFLIRKAGHSILPRR